MKAWLLKWIFGIVATTTAVTAPISQPPVVIPEPQIIERQVVTEVNNSAYDSKISSLEKRILELERKIATLESRKPEERIIERVETIREVPVADPRMSVLEKVINDFKDEQAKLHDKISHQINVLCYNSVGLGPNSLKYRCGSNTWWMIEYPSL